MKDNECKEKISNWDGYVDISMSEEECLIYQLNSDNSTSYRLKDIEFGLPETITVVPINYTNPNDDINANTKVLVSAKTGSEYLGSDTYNYRRIDLNTQWQILHSSNEILLPDDLNDINAIKRRIYRKMPVRLESINIIDTIRNGVRYLDIYPIDNSYLYIGTLSLIRKDINSPMSKIRRAKMINGLDYHIDTSLIISDGLDY